MRGIGIGVGIQAAIERLASAGVTDFHAAIFPHGGDARGAMARTFEFLAELARR